MKLYSELQEAISETLGEIDESPEFKGRFRKLISNYFDRSCAHKDILDLIHAVKFEEDRR